MTAAPKHRWFRFVFSLRTLFVVVTIAGLIGWWIELRRERVQNPETGFAFPDVAEVASIQIIKYHTPETGSVEDRHLPIQIWPEVLEALSPSEYDSDALKWEVLGELRITEKNGETIFVALFDLGPDRLGAFNAGGEAWHTRTYFRGGNSSRLKAAITKAIRQSLLLAAPPATH
jgi:hypothetical protein